MTDNALLIAQQLLNTSPVAAVVTGRNYTPIWFSDAYKTTFEEFETIDQLLNEQLTMERDDCELFKFQKIFIPILVKYKKTGENLYLTKYPIYGGEKFIVSLVSQSQWIDNSSYSDEFFKQAFLMAPSPIVLFSFFSGKIQYLNAAFSKICCMPPEHITNMTLEHLFPEGKDTIAEYLARPEPYTKPFIINAIQLDGKMIALEISPFVFNENGNIMVVFNVQDITKHMASQLDVINDDSEQYQFLLKSISDATVVTEGKKIVNVNDKACRLWGYKKNELVGTYLSILFKDGKIDYKAADTLSPIPFVGIRKGGTVFAGEKISKYFFNLSGSVMVNVLRPLEASTDWDSGRELVSDGFEKKILDYQPNFIMVYDNVNNLISCNKVMLDFFKCANVTDFKNKYIDISKLFLDKLGSFINSKDGANWFTLPIENPKNEYKAAIAGIDGAGEKIFFIKSVRIIDEEAPYIVSLSDITETVQTTLVFKDANSLLVEKSDNAVLELQIREELLVQQQKLASMGEMLSVITHQWKQPLNAIGILSQHIEAIVGDCGECSFGGEISEMTASIMEHLNFISETTDNFRDFLKSGDKQLDMSLNKAIISTIKILNIIFKKNDIVIEYNCPQPDSEIRIFGHMNDFRQVVMNIVSNSKDAILERRELEKNDFQGKVSITLSRVEGKRVEVEIQDNGAGISDEALEKMFDRDFTTKRNHGNGIGMYISKLIIDRMGGKIKCNNLKYGAGVTVSLPIVENSEDAS